MTRSLYGVSLAMLLATGACDGPSADNTEQPKNVAAIAPASSAKAPVAGCADRLTGEADKDSFDAAGIKASAKDLGAWVKDGTAAFKSAAAGLCAKGTLPPTKLASKRRLLIQYGGGADSAAVYEAESAPADEIILQYAYEPDSPGPDEADVSEAILCWNTPDADPCAGREP